MVLYLFNNSLGLVRFVKEGLRWKKANTYHLSKRFLLYVVLQNVVLSKEGLKLNYISLYYPLPFIFFVLKSLQTMELAHSKPIIKRRANE